MIMSPNPAKFIEKNENRQTWIVSCPSVFRHPMDVSAPSAAEAI